MSCVFSFNRKFYGPEASSSSSEPGTGSIGLSRTNFLRTTFLGEVCATCKEALKPILGVKTGSWWISAKVVWCLTLWGKGLRGSLCGFYDCTEVFKAILGTYFI